MGTAWFERAPIPFHVCHGPPFIGGRGCHSGTHEVERAYSVASLSLVLQDKMHLMRGLGVPSLYRGRERGPSRPLPLLLASTRALASDACGAMKVGRQLRWCDDGAFTKICMPPRRHLMSWPGSCMLPRRCLPSWLGWQLHANGGGDLADAGLELALLASLVRALPGGPTRALSWRAIVPSKDLAGGLVALPGKDLADDRCLLILI